MKREAKLFGYLALFLGCFCILNGAFILVGASSQPTGLSCKAICGLTLLTTELLGSFAGSLVGGLLWMVVGAAFSFFGYGVLRHSYGASSGIQAD